MKAKGRKRRLSSKKKTMYIIAAAVLAVALLVFFSEYPKLTSLQHSEDKAVIIDQLDATFPNRTFLFASQALLSDHGFSTYYYQAGAIDVNFYRELPSRGFSLIILRVHSALNVINGVGELSLFTNEKWDDAKASGSYLTDVLADRVVPVAYRPNSTVYFGITSRFIRESMNGGLDRSTILMMGCDGLSVTEMAETFVKNKGAKVCIGWKGPVNADHTDASTTYLLEALLQGKSVETAVQETMQTVGPDPDFGSTFSWYPNQAGNSTLSAYSHETPSTFNSHTTIGRPFGITTRVLLTSFRDFERSFFQVASQRRVRAVSHGETSEYADLDCTSMQG